MNHLLLEKEVEIDESHLFREKKSSTPHRQYKHGHIWLFGAKERNSSKFFIIALKNRTEATLIPIIRKHIKIGSTIYSDSFSVYVNNNRKESKLQKYFLKKLNFIFLGMGLCITLLTTNLNLSRKFQVIFTLIP